MQHSRKRNRKKTVVVAAGIAALAAPAAAWAAVNLFGFGTFEAAAGTPTNLVVEQTSLTGTLAPGQTVGAKGVVKNPNDFPVKLLHVLVRNGSVQTTGAGCNPASLDLLGAAGGEFPAAPGGPSTKQALAEQVTIPPGGAVWITVPAAVKQAANADAMCGVKADFAVAGQVGN